MTTHTHTHTEIYTFRTKQTFLKKCCDVRILVQTLKNTHGTACLPAGLLLGLQSGLPLRLPGPGTNSSRPPGGLHLKGLIDN